MVIVDDDVDDNDDDVGETDDDYDYNDDNGENNISNLNENVDVFCTQGKTTTSLLTASLLWRNG